jgi:hypothetical protein
MKLIAEKAYPVIKDVYEKETTYENIAIPITDGYRQRQAIANLKKAFTVWLLTIGISKRKLSGGLMMFSVF